MNGGKVGTKRRPLHVGFCPTFSGRNLDYMVFFSTTIFPSKLNPPVRLTSGLHKIVWGGEFKGPPPTLHSGLNRGHRKKIDLLKTLVGELNRVAGYVR